MYSIIMIFIIIIFIRIIFRFIFIFLSEKEVYNRNRITPFECGFSPFKKARRPFSIRFFIITLIFLVFDVEIALLLPLGLINMVSIIYFIKTIGYMICIILILGLIYEWNKGKLIWVKWNNNLFRIYNLQL